MDWIGPLPIKKSGIMYIFHIICYFSRYFFTFASPTANNEDVIRLLRILFIRYYKLLAIYCDKNQHFDNEETKIFLHDEEINVSFSTLGIFKSTGIVEVGNRIV